MESSTVTAVVMVSLRSSAPTSIETNICIMLLTHNFTSSEITMESCIFAAIMNTTPRYRANLLHVKRSIVTLCAGPHMACMWNAFSMNQHTSVTLSQLLIHSFLQYCSLCYSLADVNFQREVPTVCHNPITTPTTRHTKVTPITVGEMEETIRDMGRMVACDNPNCPREWFHFECVGLTRKPRGKWYCSDSCRGQASISM